jgi:hypothetical protein
MRLTIPQVSSGGGSSTLVTTTKTADFSASASDDITLIDATSASVVGTLPAASTVTKPLYFVRTDESLNNVSLIPDGADTINDLTEVILNRKDAVLMLVSDQVSSFKVISQGRQGI